MDLYYFTGIFFIFLLVCLRLYWKLRTAVKELGTVRVKHYLTKEKSRRAEADLKIIQKSMFDMVSKSIDQDKKIIQLNAEIESLQRLLND